MRKQSHPLLIYRRVKELRLLRPLLVSAPLPSPTKHLRPPAHNVLPLPTHAPRFPRHTPSPRTARTEALRLTYFSCCCPSYSLTSPTRASRIPRHTPSYRTTRTGHGGVSSFSCCAPNTPSHLLTQSLSPPQADPRLPHLSPWATNARMLALAFHLGPSLFPRPFPCFILLTSL